MDAEGRLTYTNKVLVIYILMGKRVSVGVCLCACLLCVCVWERVSVCDLILYVCCMHVRVCVFA